MDVKLHQFMGSYSNVQNAQTLNYVNNVKQMVCTLSMLCLRSENQIKFLSPTLVNPLALYKISN